MKATSTFLTGAMLALMTARCGEPQLATALNEEPGNGGTMRTGESPQPGQPSPGTGGTEMQGAVGISPTTLDPAAGTGGSPAMTGTEATGPYAPRSGSFKMLVYSRTTGFRHDSIAQGKVMLQEIAAEQGFGDLDRKSTRLNSSHT